MSQPRDVKCPTCGADVDWPCRTSGGYRAKTHARRWRAIGIADPTPEQLHSAYINGISRDIEIGRRAVLSSTGGDQ